MVELKDLPQYLFRPLEPTVVDTVSPPPSSPPPVEHVVPLRRENSDWTNIEKEMILNAMRESGGNRTKAARLLGWGRTTLWRKLKKHQLT